MQPGTMGGAYVRTSVLGAICVRPAGGSRRRNGFRHVVAPTSRAAAHRPEACKMAGIVKVMLTVVALVDGDHSLDAHAKDIIANAQELFAPAVVKVENVELADLEQTEPAIVRLKTQKID